MRSLCRLDLPHNATPDTDEVLVAHDTAQGGMYLPRPSQGIVALLAMGHSESPCLFELSKRVHERLWRSLFE